MTYTGKAVRGTNLAPCPVTVNAAGNDRKRPCHSSTQPETSELSRQIWVKYNGWRNAPRW